MKGKNGIALNDLNVFQYINSSFKYYLQHPISFFRQLFRALKFAYQRITRGYCDMDTWGLDYYLLRMLPAALRDMKDSGYPAFGGYANQESWNKFLEGLAADLDSLKEDWSETKNEYADEFHLHGLNNAELKENYKNRILELSKMQQQLATNTFTKIGEHLFDLWT